MNQIIKFSARGTEFQIPKILLKNKPKSLLFIMSDADFNVPIDKINNCIYIDVNPLHINFIVEYYVMNVFPDTINQNIYLYMDFKYLGLLNDSHILPSCVPCYMTYPIINKTNLCNIDIKQKYCRIHTIDNHIIISDLSIYATHNLWNDLLSIMFGQINEFIINKSDEYIDVWIGFSKKIINILLSIMRDGLNWYYCSLNENEYSPKKNININNKQVPNKVYYNSENDIRSNIDTGFLRCKCCWSYDGKCSECNNNEKYLESLLQTNHIDQSVDNQRKYTETSLNNIEKDVYNFENNKNIMKYLKFYNICDNNIQKQFFNRKSRYEKLGDSVYSEFILKNEKFSMFTDDELELKECHLLMGSKRYDFFWNLWKECEKIKFIVKRCYPTNLRKHHGGDMVILFKNIDIQLNNELSNYIMNYVCGL